MKDRLPRKIKKALKAKRNKWMKPYLDYASNSPIVSKEDRVKRIKRYYNEEFIPKLNWVDSYKSVMK